MLKSMVPTLVTVAVTGTVVAHTLAAMARVPVAA
jgi:hypothetical protein